jgi:hypothetical protein
MFFNKGTIFKTFKHPSMEQHALKNVNNCYNTKIYFYFVTSSGWNSNIYLIVVYFFNTSVFRHLLQFKTAVFLHRGLFAVGTEIALYT